jgi:tRNA dimethylallyltransferase
LDKVICITGPTASGKTSISIELAKRLNGEIISADSMQIYKGLDIGSAKVTEKEMENIPHHLISIVNSDDNFSVADFKKNCIKTIDEIIKRKKNTYNCWWYRIIFFFYNK